MLHFEFRHSNFENRERVEGSELRVESLCYISNFDFRISKTGSELSVQG